MPENEEGPGATTAPGTTKTIATSTNGTASAHGDAERLDRRIRLLVGSINDNITKLLDLVNDAKHGDIHVTLGFPSWTAYVADVCDGIAHRLPAAPRRELVQYLAGEGMSERGIAAVTGASKTTVHRDVVQMDHLPPGSDEVEVIDAVEIVTEPTPVTGLDGKTYQRRQPAPQPEPSSPRRRPITDAFHTATWELDKAVRKLDRLVEDDRFARNRETIAGANLGDLDRIENQLAIIVSDLKDEPDTAPLLDQLVSITDILGRMVDRAFEVCGKLGRSEIPKPQATALTRELIRVFMLSGQMVGVDNDVIRQAVFGDAAE